MLVSNNNYPILWRSAIYLVDEFSQDKLDDAIHFMLGPKVGMNFLSNLILLSKRVIVHNNILRSYRMQIFFYSCENYLRIGMVVRYKMFGADRTALHCFLRFPCETLYFQDLVSLLQ
jgi:hypothetical protein